MLSFRRQTFDKLPFTVAGDPKSRQRMMGFRFSLVLAAMFFVGFLLSLADLLLPGMDLFSRAELGAVLFGSVFGTALLGGLAYVITVIGKKKWRIYRVDRTEVVCLDGHGTLLWREPTHVYRGIRWREERYSALPFGGATLQALYLVHAMPAHTVKFIETENLSYALDCCRSWALALGLPTLQEVAGQDTTREPKDFDRPLLALREEGVEGPVEVNFDAATPPPPGVSWRKDSDRWRATLRIYYPLMVGQLVIMVIGGLLGLVVCTAMIAVGLAENSLWGFVGAIAVGLFFIKFPIWPLIAVVFGARKQLIVSHKEAVASIEVLGLSLRRRAIALPKIIRISMSDRGFPSFVVLEDRDTRVRIGELEENVAAWLNRFALAAVIDIGLAPVGLKKIADAQKHKR